MPARAPRPGPRTVVSVSTARWPGLSLGWPPGSGPGRCALLTAIIVITGLLFLGGLGLAAWRLSELAAERSFEGVSRAWDAYLASRYRSTHHRA